MTRRKYSELKSVRVKSSPFLGRGKGLFFNVKDTTGMQDVPKPDLHGKPCGPGQTKKRDGCIPKKKPDPRKPKSPVAKPIDDDLVYLDDDDYDYSLEGVDEDEYLLDDSDFNDGMISGSAVDVHPETGKLQFDPSKVKEVPKPSPEDVIKYSLDDDKFYNPIKTPHPENYPPTLSIADAAEKYKKGIDISVGDKLMLLDAAYLYPLNRKDVITKGKIINIVSILSDLHDEEKEEILSYAAKRLHETNNVNLYGSIAGNEKVSKEDRILWSDILDDMVAKQNKEPKSSIKGERMRSWGVTKDYKVFEEGFADDWASDGNGVDAQVACSLVVSKTAIQNKDKDFWSEYAEEEAEEKFALDRLQKHFTQLKKNTEEFYKDRLNQPLEVKRGVQFRGDTYLPSAGESWTTHDATAKRFAFGKLGSVLEASVTYNDVLFSYESFKNNPGWPPEEYLLGKQEFVILGGALKNIIMEKL